MAGNLELVNNTSATDGVTEILITDIFTDKYDVYQLTFTNFQSNANFGLDMRFLDTSGTEISTTNYDKAMLAMAAYTSFVEIRATSQNYIDRFIDMYGFSATGQSSYGTCYIFNPYSNTSYTFYVAQGGLMGANFSGTKSIGVLKTTDRVGGIKLYSDSANTFKTMEISTYGLASN